MSNHKVIFDGTESLTYSPPIMASCEPASYTSWEDCHTEIRNIRYNAQLNRLLWNERHHINVKAIPWECLAEFRNNEDLYES